MLRRSSSLNNGQPAFAAGTSPRLTKTNVHNSSTKKSIGVNDGIIPIVPKIASGDIRVVDTVASSNNSVAGNSFTNTDSSVFADADAWLQSSAASLLVKRCMVSFQWEESLARRVVAEYIKFIDIKVRMDDLAEQNVVPPHLVHLMWQTHYMDSRTYIEDMRSICGPDQYVHFNHFALTDQSSKATRVATTEGALKAIFGANGIDREIWTYYNEAKSTKASAAAQTIAARASRVRGTPNGTPSSSSIMPRRSTQGVRTPTMTTVNESDDENEGQGNGNNNFSDGEEDEDASLDEDEEITEAGAVGSGEEDVADGDEDEDEDDDDEDDDSGEGSPEPIVQKKTTIRRPVLPTSTSIAKVEVPKATRKAQAKPKAPKTTPKTKGTKRRTSSSSAVKSSGGTRDRRGSRPASSTKRRKTASPKIKSAAGIVEVKPQADLVGFSSGPVDITVQPTITMAPGSQRKASTSRSPAPALLAAAGAGGDRTSTVVTIISISNWDGSDAMKFEVISTTTISSLKTYYAKYIGMEDIVDSLELLSNGVPLPPHKTLGALFGQRQQGSIIELEASLTDLEPLDFEGDLFAVEGV